MKLFLLRYKLNGAPREKVFEAENIESARLLAQKWCKAFRNRLVFVQPFSSDLQSEIESLNKPENEKEREKVAAKRVIPTKANESLSAAL